MERADEIIAAWEAREAELLERAREFGVAQAEALVTRLHEQSRGIVERIMKHPANTLPALAIKARLAAEWNDEDWFLEIADALDALATTA